MKVKVVLALDTTGSMGDFYKSVVCEIHQLMAPCLLINNLNIQFIEFKDFGDDDNGIKKYDIETIDQFVEALSRIQIKGGNGNHHEASATAILESLSDLGNQYDGALMYILTDEGTRLFEHSDKDLVKEANKSKRDVAEYKPSTVAQVLEKKNVKLMVLSNDAKAYNHGGFKSLEKESQNITADTGIKRVQLLVSTNYKKMLAVITHDILFSIISDMDPSNTQELFGKTIDTVQNWSYFRGHCVAIGIENEDHISSLFDILNADRKNKHEEVSLDNGDTKFLHFSIAQSWWWRHNSQYSMLVGDCSDYHQKADDLAKRIIDNHWLFAILANNASLGAMIRNFIMRYASQEIVAKYANGLKRNSESIEDAQNQQKVRLALNAKSVKSEVLNACHNSNGVFYLKGPVPQLDTMARTNFLNMTPEMHKFVRDELLPEIEYRPIVPTNGECMEKDGKLIFTPADGELCIRSVPMLMHTNLVFNHVVAPNTFTFSCIILAAEAETDLPPMLVTAARSIVSKFTFENAVNSPAIHSECLRRLLIDENVKKSLDQRISNLAWQSSYIDMLMKATKLQETHYVRKHIARLVKQPIENLMTCVGCNQAKFPSSFMASPTKNLCHTCSISCVDPKLNKVATGILTIFDYSKADVPPLKKKSSSKNIFNKLYLWWGLGWEECNDLVKNNDIELKCFNCHHFYSVWAVNKAPKDISKHLCAVCRTCKMLKLVAARQGEGVQTQTHLQSLLLTYAQEWHKLINLNTNHTLNIQFLVHHLTQLSPKTKWSKEEKDFTKEELISALEKLVSRENGNGLDKPQSSMAGSGWSSNDPNITYINRCEEKSLRGLLTTKDVEEFYCLQTGISLDFLGNSWNEADVNRTPYFIFHGKEKNIVAQARLLSSEEQFKIINEGLLATGVLARAFLRTKLPESVDIDDVMKEDGCHICFEGGPVYIHCSLTSKFCFKCFNKFDPRVCPYCRKTLSKVDLKLAKHVIQEKIKNKNMKRNNTTKQKSTQPLSSQPQPPSSHSKKIETAIETTISVGTRKPADKLQSS